MDTVTEKIVINPRKKNAVIDQRDNRYNCAGRTIQAGRAIRDGKFGQVTDVVVGIRQITPGGGLEVHTYHFGTGSIETANLTLESMKRIMGR